MQGAWWGSPSSVQGQDSAITVNPWHPGISYNSMNFAGAGKFLPVEANPGNVLQPFASSLGCLKVRVEQNFRNKSNKPGLAAPVSAFSAI